MSSIIKKARPLYDEKVITLRTVPREPVGKKEPPEPVPTLDWAKVEAKAKALLAEASREAEKIVNEALKEKERLLAELEQARQRVMNEAYKKGFDEGSKAGYHEWSRRIEQAREILCEARSEFERTVSQAEPEILSIALKAAEKIVAAEFSEHPEKFVHLVKKAVKEAKGYKEVQVYVHPDHFPRLVERQKEIFSQFYPEGHYFLYPDDRLPENGCVIETEGGKIDASVDSQFQELREKLFEIWTGSEDEGDRHH